MSNLRLINETTASSVSSLSITDIFSADFDIYKITLTDYDNLGSSNGLNFRFVNASGSIITASDYDHASQIIRSYSAFGEDNSATASSISTISYDDTLQKSNGSVAYIFNPFNSSSYTFALWQNSSASTIGTVGRKGIALLHQTNSITGINFIPNSSSNFSINSVKVYGLRVDS
tara:strand:+ start:561 stop:1082 length:522 start_codon:yes stop_codon:yes gene_type:complete